MNPFHEFVQENRRWFAGRGHETHDTLAAAESELAISIPADVRWLLTEYGYWHATGISSLDETVEDTKAAREHLQLPHRFIILYNHHDGGGILLDTETEQQTDEYKVFNIGWESIPDAIVDEIVFPSYFAYVQDQLRLKRDFIDPEHVDYNPDDYAFD